MSTLPVGNERAPALPDALLSLLRRHDNPFDDFVQSRHPGGSFRRRHVPAVNRDALEKLQATIDRYRLNGEDAHLQSLTLDDIPRSGVLLILGPRGAGKTHLVHALRLQDTGGLVIAPNHFEPHRPFAEYLLQLVVRSLQQDVHAAGTPLVQQLADWLARRVAVQALYGMTEIEWLARQSRQDDRTWRALWGWGSRALADRRELLIKSLLDANCRSVADVCRFREQSQDELKRIALRQVEMSETSSTIGGQIRLGLYLHLVELAFHGDADRFFEFLMDGFTQVDAPLSASRETLVEELLASLTEMFLLFGYPLVFAFDALETLLSDPPDEKRCHAFFRGLAEVLDSHRGLPIFLFAEAGHWELAQRYLSSYAQQRLQQGVPTRGHGSLRLVSLPLVTADDLEQLVAARMAGFTEAGENAQQSAEFRIGPFCRQDLIEVARSGADAPPLRQMLQALRDLYQQRVFGERGMDLPTFAAPADENGLAKIDLLEFWKREYKAALRQVENGTLGTLANALQSGLHAWLAHLAHEGASWRAWTPGPPEAVTFGNSPAFGQLVRSRWRASEEEHELGLAFLLGQRSSMPRDLKEKLLMMISPQPVVPLLRILWPHVLECAGPAQKHLPPATRKVWDDLVDPRLAACVELQAIESRCLATWLAIEPWEAALREEGLVSRIELERFLADETGDLLALVAPRESAATPAEPEEESLVATA